MASVSIESIAVIDKKILIAHRNPVGQMGSRWEFPGGKAEEGESNENALIREFEEEFGVTVKVQDLITQNEFEHNGKKFTLNAYLISVPHDGVKTKYVLTEHTEYKWASMEEIESIPKENFVDSDLKIIPDVKKYLIEKGLI